MSTSPGLSTPVLRNNNAGLSGCYSLFLDSLYKSAPPLLFSCVCHLHDARILSQTPLWNNKSSCHFYWPSQKTNIIQESPGCYAVISCVRLHGGGAGMPADSFICFDLQFPFISHDTLGQDLFALSKEAARFLLLIMACTSTDCILHSMIQKWRTGIRTIQGEALTLDARSQWHHARDSMKGYRQKYTSKDYPAVMSISPSP